MKTFTALSTIVALSCVVFADAGILTALGAYGICQTGCNVLVVSCYTGAGLVFGTVSAGTAIPVAAVACNTGLGACMASCASVTLAATIAPTP